MNKWTWIIGGIAVLLVLYFFICINFVTLNLVGCKKVI